MRPQRMVYFFTATYIQHKGYFFNPVKRLLFNVDVVVVESLMSNPVPLFIPPVCW